MLLSAAIIVRDQAHHLDSCLGSLGALVDEIIVVDTGSTDASVAVARRHGAVIAHDPWHNDFSRARNRSLELASSEWILYIDADERVRAGDHAAARAAIAGSPSTLAYRVRFVPRVGWTPYREYRLWRNRPGIRFEGAMHESIVPAVHAAAESEGLGVAPFDHITLDHLGYEGDQSAKRARDEPMLLAEIDRVPSRTYLYDHLARVYESAGEADAAVATWWRGIEVARAHGCAGPDDRLVYIDLLFHLLQHGSLDDSFAALLDEARRAFPGVPALDLAAARYAFATGDPGAAIPIVERLLSLSLEDIMATEGSYDGRIFDEWSWHLLGLARFALGDHDGAADAFARAGEAAPDNPLYVQQQQFARARAAPR